MKTNLSPSLEDYLEAILQLETKNKVARVKEIAEFLSVQMPSVTGALKSLKSKGLIDYEKNSYITLSPKGLEIAQSIQNKHSILTRFLSETLLLPQEIAEDQACKIEHIISSETSLRIKKLSEFLKTEHSQEQMKKLLGRV